MEFLLNYLSKSTDFLQVIGAQSLQLISSKNLECSEKVFLICPVMFKIECCVFATN